MHKPGYKETNIMKKKKSKKKIIIGAAAVLERFSVKTERIPYAGSIKAASL